MADDKKAPKKSFLGRLVRLLFCAVMLAAVVILGLYTKSLMDTSDPTPYPWQWDGAHWKGFCSYVCMEPTPAPAPAHPAPEDPEEE